MAEAIIKYKSRKTLELLKNLSKQLGFTVSAPKGDSSQKFKINGVTILRGDSSIDVSDLEDVFSKKNIDAADLRAKSWRRM